MNTNTKRILKLSGELGVSWNTEEIFFLEEASEESKEKLLLKLQGEKQELKIKNNKIEKMFKKNLQFKK